MPVEEKLNPIDQKSERRNFLPWEKAYWREVENSWRTGKYISRCFVPTLSGFPHNTGVALYTAEFPLIIDSSLGPEEVRFEYTSKNAFQIWVEQGPH